MQDGSCRLRLSQATFCFKFPDLPSEVRTDMSLLAKLRELREARDAGFISEAEEAHAKGRLLLASHLASATDFLFSNVYFLRQKR